MIDRTAHIESGEDPRQGPDQAAAGSTAAEERLAAAELEAALTVLRQGDVVTGRVVQVSADSVMIDVGYKSEGVIPLNELSSRPGLTPEQMLHLGDEIRVMVLNVEGPEGTLRLSKRRVDEMESWKRVQEWYGGGTTVEAAVSEAVKGGLVVDLGLRAFLPASQVERGYVADLAKYVGQRIRVKIIEIDKHKNRVILSRKKVMEEEREMARTSFWDNVHEGQVRPGNVKSLTDFGAFVDLGGVDGLLHVSEMSYGRVKHPGEVLKEGQEVTVKVIRLDRDKGKVSLSMKQTLPDPWVSVSGRYVEGTVVEGRVARLATFGAFVELEPGVDGLIHISQLADYRVVKPDDVVQVGQMVQAKVIQVRPEDRRISLSLRDMDTGAGRQAAAQVAAAQEDSAADDDGAAQPESEPDRGDVTPAPGARAVVAGEGG